MVGSERGEPVDENTAKGVGIFLLSERTLQEAAEAADITPWELEDALESAELGDRIDFGTDRTASETIDDLFENGE